MPKFKTTKEATQYWVNGFNAIPQSLISKAYVNDIDGIMEVTPTHNEDVEYNDYFPMWGTMWYFGDSIDDWWLGQDNNLQKMADCGFRIYECDDLGYVFGIDGAGYDFYESHWIPLYKARGLCWSEQDINEEILREGI